MSLAEADIAFAKELFSALPDITTRKMFGGMSIYSDGVIFALIRSDAQIFIKSQNDEFSAKLADMGSEIWSYTRKNGTETAMPYWTLPDAAIDDPDLATSLGREALDLLR
ncbi:MAG: TfoX/Sxy family protein [Sulfitobacter sp.]